MAEKPLGSPADHAEAIAVASKPKRRGVMYDPDDRTPTQSFVRLTDVPTEHARHRDLGIRQKPIQRFSISDRGHLFGKTVSRIHGCQRDDASQSLVEPRITQRVAVEFRDGFTHVEHGFGHDRMRSQPGLKAISDV